MLKLDILSVLFILFGISAIALGDSNLDIKETIAKMHWFGQASFRIDDNDQHIYIDPFDLPDDSPVADIIFITHGHGDHLSADQIKKIADKNTLIVGPASVEEQLKSLEIPNLKLVNPYDTLEVKQIPVEVVPAYNIKKTKYHPKENNWVGYIFTINGTKIYHAGDTERIPEMKKYNCDIALMPLGQTYTMDSVKEAAEAIMDIKPKVAIPMHYGIYEGKSEDAEKFQTYLEGHTDVVLLEMEK